MAADSKTVEGESAVVKAEEGNTATEQEAAPALSEEELNAMYERFQQRLQKEGTRGRGRKSDRKTLEIRRQIVEKKVEREKQAERQKKIAKSREGNNKTLGTDGKRRLVLCWLWELACLEPV